MLRKTVYDAEYETTYLFFTVFVHLGAKDSTYCYANILVLCNKHQLCAVRNLQNFFNKK